MKHVPHKRPTNIRCHPTKFNCFGDPTATICAPLIDSVKNNLNKFISKLNNTECCSEATLLNNSCKEEQRFGSFLQRTSDVITAIIPPIALKLILMHLWTIRCRIILCSTVQENMCIIWPSKRINTFRVTAIQILTVQQRTYKRQRKYATMCV